MNGDGEARRTGGARRTEGMDGGGDVDRDGDARRTEVLREMGITTVWKLRSTEQAPASAAALLPEAAPVAREPTPSMIQGATSVTADGDSAVEQLDWPALQARVASCTACALHAKRNKTVFGVGDERAAWLFVGEGPGAEEDEQGEPFVGQAGKLLDNMLAAIDLKRGANVYIANIVKCRPPGNRNPQPDEAQACSSYLQRQIALIQPKLIVALGKVAAVNLLGRDASIASLRGQMHAYRGIPLIVTYHPAYLLRTLQDKAKAWQDLCFAVDAMQRLQTAQSAAI